MTPLPAGHPSVAAVQVEPPLDHPDGPGRQHRKEEQLVIPARIRRGSSVVFGAMASIAVIGSTLAVGDVRLSNDVAGGYVSAYTLATGQPYTDDVIRECAVSRGRQNEPAVEMDPRNSNVLIGSSNDYCGVYQPPGDPAPQPVGPIWL